MARKLLIVDSSSVMRTIIRSTILSHLGDVVVLEATTGMEAYALLEKERCDLVLSSWEVPELDGVELFWKLKQQPELKSIPFVLMSSKSDEAKLLQLKDAGIKSYITTPFEPETLVKIINTNCNPIQMRASTRYAIPGGAVTLQQGKMQFPADLVNISGGGFLCDMAFDKGLDPFSPNVSRVDFPADYGNLSAGGMLSVLVNMTVLAFAADHTPQEIRLAFKFISVPANARQALEAAFQIAQASTTAP